MKQSKKHLAHFPQFFFSPLFITKLYEKIEKKKKRNRFKPKTMSYIYKLFIILLVFVKLFNNYWPRKVVTHINGNNIMLIYEIC